MNAKKLSEIININGNFRNAINLYLSLNKKDKIESYIPTKSSVDILKTYVNAVLENKHQSTILIGSYGKGKSHLLLILLSLLSMEKNKENNETIENLLQKIKAVDEEAYSIVHNAWNNHDRFLPVIISGNQDDLNQAFMVALNNALKNDGLSDIMPDTYYSIARDTINRWKNEYKETYDKYEQLLKERGKSVKEINDDLKVCKTEGLELFKEVYPLLTAGSTFNPLVGGDAVPMYKSIAYKLKEEHGYSGLYIVFDEFSKFIEGQDKKSKGVSMKLIQDLCELANESSNPQIYFTMVAHKSIKEYGKYLSDSTINAFTGIEGRIEEILFNTSSKNNYELVKNAINIKEDSLERVPNADRYFGSEIADRFYEIPAFKSNFTKDDFNKIVLKGCFPLNPATAYALLNVSEKVAQNERTLFTFISKDEPHSLARYVKEHPSLNAKNWSLAPDKIYDYFKNIFKKDVTNEFIHNEWLNADYAISQVKGTEKENILKTLAIISIINKYEELPPTKEILELTSGVSDASRLIDEMENDKLIYLRKSNNCFSFKTRAGSELKKEIKNRRTSKNDINLSKIFSEVAESAFVIPKKYNNEYSMTRYFRYEYMSIYDFARLEDLSVIFEDGKFQDGKILSLYSTDDVDYSEELFKRIEESDIRNLVITYSKHKFDLSDTARDYKIIQDIKNDSKFISENQVLIKELSIMESELKKELHDFVSQEFGENNSNSVIYYNNGSWVIDGQIKISKIVDAVCENLYSETIVINNELINKQFVTTAPIKKARKTIINRILEKTPDDDYRIGTSAEATIYRAVMVNTGIVNNKPDEKLDALLGLFNEYLESCVDNKAPVSKLFARYTAAPYGMRAGAFPIIFAYKLEQIHSDIVVYYKDNEVEMTADCILNMIEHPEDYYVYISKENAEKEKYIAGLSELFKISEQDNLHGNRIAIILECMQRWYRSLPQIAKNIQKNNQFIEDKNIVAIIPKLKKVMQRIDANAYETIFSTIPEICSDKADYKETLSVLSNLKNLLNNYMNHLIQQTIENTKLVFDRKGKEDLRHTLINWYDKQSDYAKNGLHNATISGLMSYIAEINTYDESEITKKLVKIVSNVYIDNWSDNSFDEYIEALKNVKESIENIANKETKNKYKLSFVGKNGDNLDKYYEHVDESTGAILRNILEDSLEDFSDLDVNAKVSILLEMIERIMRKED